MGKIVTKNSAVETFTEKTAIEYKQILNSASEVIEEISKMSDDTSGSISYAEKQLHQLAKLASDVENSINEIMRQVREIESEIEELNSAREEIINHPIIEYHTDSEGNTYTTSRIDTAALAAIDEQIKELQYQLRLCEEKRNKLAEILSKIEAEINNLDMYIKAMGSILLVLSESTSKIETCSAEINEIASINIKQLFDVLESIKAYISNKTFDISNGVVGVDDSKYFR